MTKRFVVTDSLKNEEIYVFKSQQESIDVAEILNKKCQELDAEVECYKQQSDAVVEHYKRKFKDEESKLLREQRRNVKLVKILDKIKDALEEI